MSILTVEAQPLTTANGLWNTGVQADGTTLITGDPTGVANPIDPHYTVTYYANGAGNASATPSYTQLGTAPLRPPPATYTTGYYGTPTTTGSAYVADPSAVDPYSGSEDWVTSASPSQWITYEANMGTTTSPAGTVLETPSTAVTVYALTLTGMPVGRLVTIGGTVASDDNVTVYGNGKKLFSNYGALDDGSINATNYNGLNSSTNTLPGGLTFVSGGSNILDFVVYNNGGYATGIDAQLTGSYTIIQFTGLNLTPNQQSVLNYINQVNEVGVTNACFGNLILTLYGVPGSDFGLAMDELSPEKLNIFSSIAFNNATFMTQNLDDYLAHRRNQAGYFQANPGFIDTTGLTINDPTIDSGLSQIYSRLLAWNPAPESAGLLSDVVDPLSLTQPSVKPVPTSTDLWNVFIQGNVILGQDFSNMDLAHENSTTSSFMIGTDYEVTKNFLIGTFFNYSHSDANLDTNGSSATVDTYSPGIYASYAKDGWYGNGLASYGHNAYTEQRNIDIVSTTGAFIKSPYGAPEGDQEVVDLDGGYDFHDNNWTYGPTLGFQYVHLNVDPFNEYGGCSSDLAVTNEAADSFRSRLGGHVSYTTQTGGVQLTPFLDTSWQHEYLDDSRGITSSFSEIGFGQFTVYTPDPGRESALVATGVNIDIDKRTTVYVDYEAQVTPSYYFGQSVLAGVKVAF